MSMRVWKWKSNWKSPEEKYQRSWRDITWSKGGYQLEFRSRCPGDTPDTGWYLYGPNGMPFGAYMARTLLGAKVEADNYIEEHGHDRGGN